MSRIRHAFVLLPALAVMPIAQVIAQEDQESGNRAGAGKRQQINSDWSLSIKSVATAGVGVRTHEQKDGLVPGGRNNSDDGNLNYEKGDTFSRVIKFSSTVDAQHSSGIGIVAGAMAWTDEGLRNHSVPHGNNPNAYMPNTPLSDAGFDRAARFSGVQPLNLHIYGRREIAKTRLDWKIGLVAMERERGFSFTGGLRDLETRNTAASGRPGSQADEGILPVWAATSRWAVTPELRFDAFLQFLPEQSVAPGCGTYLSGNDYTAEGCNRVFYSSARSEQQNVARGIFTPRSADIKPDNKPDQGGFGVSYLARNWGTRFGAYVARYHSRSGYTDVLKGATVGPTGGSTYAIEYPEDKKLLALTSATRHPGLKLTWLNELSVIFGQPVQLNNSDLQEAFITGRGILGESARAAAPNTLFKGYDRFRVTQLQTGVMKEFENVLGASKGFLGAEIGTKHVHGLPDVRIRRYGRPEVSDVCTSAAACATNDGYVTTNAWAYRIRAGLEYGNVAGTSIRLRPAIQFGHDVKGWSYDYAFVQGRKTLRTEIEADFGNGWFGNLNYTLSRGGQFNTRKDRDYAMVSVGRRF